MTVEAVPVPATEGGTPLTTLGAVVEALGAGLVRVVTAPRGFDVPVGEPVVHDPLGDPVPDADDLLLAVGVDPDRPSAIDLVTSCGERGAVGVLVKHDGELAAGLVAAADAAGVALLVAPQAAAWGQLHTLLRTARSVTPLRGSGGAAPPLGDLFGLADALASAIGGAVTIEDARSTVLAYSTGRHPTDDARQATILGRRVPDEWLDRLHEMGVFRRIMSSDEVVSVPPLGSLTCAPRLVVGVRAGGETLGSIWVQHNGRILAPEAEQALREAASLAALHLLRVRSGQDLARRWSGDQLRAVLDGRMPAMQLAETLQVRIDDPIVLLGMEPVESVDTEIGVPTDRLADFLVFSCAAFRQRVVAAEIGRAAYAVLAAPQTGADGARALAADLTARARSGFGVGMRTAVADAALGLGRLGELQTEVELALRVQASRHAEDAVHVQDVHPSTVLLQLRDLAAERPRLLAGKVRALEVIDRERSTSYIPTLRAFFHAFGDVRLAADAIGVHPNTFRYRLRRLSELAHLDLDDPEQRLVVQLQLHLLAR